MLERWACPLVLAPPPSSSVVPLATWCLRRDHPYPRQTPHRSISLGRGVAQAAQSCRHVVELLSLRDARLSVRGRGERERERERGRDKRYYTSHCMHDYKIRTTCILDSHQCTLYMTVYLISAAIYTPVSSCCFLTLVTWSLYLVMSSTVVV